MGLGRSEDYSLKAGVSDVKDVLCDVKQEGTSAAETFFRIPANENVKISVENYENQLKFCKQLSNHFSLLVENR